MGVYAMTLIVLGNAIGDIVDLRRDDVGLLLDASFNALSDVNVRHV
jgi:hypothetical protein